MISLKLLLSLNKYNKIIIFKITHITGFIKIIYYIHKIIIKNRSINIIYIIIYFDFFLKIKTNYSFFPTNTNFYKSVRGY